MKKTLWVILVAGVFFFAPRVHAQQVQSLSISPLTFELTANPGERVSNVIRVTNSNDFQVTAKIEIEDFAPTGEQGQVVVTEPGDNQTYSLARWMSVDTNGFSLAPQETKQIVFTIDVPVNAEPGGHYGTVLASLVGSSGPTSGVGVASKVGALVLMQVAGQSKESLDVESFTAPSFSEYGPVMLTARLKNSGTIHLKPYGFIVVQNMFGKKIAQIQLDQKNVLPGSVRRIDASLNRHWLFGKYSATLTAVYGSQNEPLTYTTSFWVIPWKFTLVVGLLILIVFTILIRSRRRIGLALRILFTGEGNHRR